VWLALFGLPLIVAVPFIGFGAYFAGVRGLTGAELDATMQRVAPFPTSIGFAVGFFVIRMLAKKDGLTLADLGWRKPGGLDLAIAFGAAAVLSAVNAFVLYPLLATAQPSFDPKLTILSLPGAALMLLVAIPVEDTLYRGYAFKVLQLRHGAIAATLITTLFYAGFAGAQGLPVVAWAVYFGLVLSGLRLWRKNLWVVAIVHCVVSLGPKVLASLQG
jgi:membrane protease YdiL (CAAX protease family)